MEEKVLVTKTSEKMEALSGVLIALVAALMAISDLVGRTVEDDRKKAEIQEMQMFNWYQSKSVKQSLQENHLQTIDLLSNTSAIVAEKKAAIDSVAKKIKTEIGRYKKEKKEILIGSKNIPKEEWAQDMDGKMGVITGVKEWNKQAAKLDAAETKFDYSMLFFQVALVFGAVCILIKDNPKLQKAFVTLMIIMTLIGAYFSVNGYLLST